MYSTFTTTVILLSVIFTTTSLAATNFTVRDDHPLIKYEGTAGHVSLCKSDVNGTLISPREPPGCFDLIPATCTSSTGVGQTKADAASLKFKGSAIYINSVLFVASPLYTVTLDGKSVDIDGARPESLGFICDTLFSQTGLDPNAGHDIRLSVKDISPTRNQTKGSAKDFFLFSLTNFIITVPDNTSPESFILGNVYGPPDTTSSTLPSSSPSPFPSPKSSSGNIGIPGLTTLLSLALLAFH